MLELAYRLFKLLEKYKNKKVCSLEMKPVKYSTKEYYNNKRRIRDLDSLWMRIRLINITEENCNEMIAKMLYTYKLMYRI